MCRFVLSGGCLRFILAWFGFVWGCTSFVWVCWGWVGVVVIVCFVWGVVCINRVVFLVCFGL